MSVSSSFIFCYYRWCHPCFSIILKKGFPQTLKLFIVPIKNDVKKTNDRPIHRLNSQWQAFLHFNWPMVGQQNVIFIGTINRFTNTSNSECKLKSRDNYSYPASSWKFVIIHSLNFSRKGYIIAQIFCCKVWFDNSRLQMKACQL